jgi:HNH endonuclease
MRRSRKPPLFSRGRGICRWCGEKIFTKTKKLDSRRKFHAECLSDYKIMAVSVHRRKAVFERDKGICAKCGKDCSADWLSWEADHIIPLYSIPRPLKKEDRKFWELGNLQTLCAAPCHIEKTAQDTANIPKPVSKRRRAKKN